MEADVTKLLEQAFEAARALPPSVQDDLARALLPWIGLDTEVVVLTEEEERDLDEADAEIARGELATNEDMDAIWAKYGR